jgi:hypothetical protein
MGLSALAAATGCSGGGGSDPIPVPPKNNPDSYKNYVNLFGDIHVHTVMSDGDESPDYALRYARDVTKLDFCSLSDHAEFIEGDDYMALPYLKEMPAKYDDPGKFCVLFGYEWTTNEWGHRNVYSVDPNIPLYSYKNPICNTPEKLWDILSGYDVVIIPHHHMKPSDNRWWDHYNPELERLVEFYSKWGLSLEEGNMRPLRETQQDNALFDAFHAGRRYGLIASSDTHQSRPGSNLMECRPGNLIHPRPGFVAVWASAHTREAIFDALKNRRCYGTTGSRINLQFSVNDSLMGSTVYAANNPNITFKASADDVITEVSFLKFFQGTHINLKTYYPNSQACEGSFVDTNFIEDASYIMRVGLANTDMALSSPIWVEKIELIG